jgi:hypothetical protein
MTDCPSRFTLLRWRTDDLPALEQVEVDRHVAGCQSCRVKAAGIDADASAYQERSEEHMERLSRALRREKAHGAAGATDLGALFRNRIAPALGIAMAAAAIVILVVRPFGDGDGSREEPGISFKGAVSLQVVVRRGDAQFTLDDDDDLREGDALRFAVTAAEAGYVSIVSIDAAGRRSCFYPETDPLADPGPYLIDAPGRHELPGSIIMDGSSGIEEIVMIFSARRFDRREVHERLGSAAASGRPFPRMDGLTVESLRIEKTPRKR